MADFELVYEVRIPIERGSYAGARDQADRRLIALREDIETGDPAGPSVMLREVKPSPGIPACNCTPERGRDGLYHTLDCRMSVNARERHRDVYGRYFEGAGS